VFFLIANNSHSYIFQSPCNNLGSFDETTNPVSRAGRNIDLQPREFAVLLELALNAGRVLTRPQLEARLYEWDQALESNAIEVHVHHLRRKLAPTLIRTVRGVGYIVPSNGGAGSA